MKKKQKITLKEVMQGGWIIEKVMQGYNGKVRISARRRFLRSDENNRYQEWVTLSYANRLRKEYGFSPLEITNY